MSKTVFVFPNLTKPQVLESLEMVLQFLGEGGVQVVLPTDLARQYGTLSFSEKYDEQSIEKIVNKIAKKYLQIKVLNQGN